MAKSKDSIELAKPAPDVIVISGVTYQGTATEMFVEARRRAWHVTPNEDVEHIVLGNQIRKARQWFKTVDDETFNTLVLKAILGRRWDAFYCGANDTGKIWNTWENLLRNAARILDGANLYDIAQLNGTAPYPLGTTGRPNKPGSTGAQLQALAGRPEQERQHVDRRPRKTY
jgi:hypothetical protein